MYAYVRNRPTQLVDPWGLRPGELYVTLDAAGIAAACDAGALTSQSPGWEYGGWLYQVPGGWTYTDALTSQLETTVDLGDPDPTRGLLAGWYHTHPRGPAVPSDPEDYNFSRAYGVPDMSGGGGRPLKATVPGQ